MGPEITIRLGLLVAVVGWLRIARNVFQDWRQLEIEIWQQGVIKYLVLSFPFAVIAVLLWGWGFKISTIESLPFMLGGLAWFFLGAVVLIGSYSGLVLLVELITGRRF